ncbi:hypothetical protein TVAG_302290 [Trichomonas vaginalis G3]|uniref:Uncharacterized protein n=1 Tax=Trichomonas vaginalis (strain ATCC PRA-98 / G3) TaxID=412133 RepID=A2EGQ4_TRIV3|nr:histone-lysine N-methyltransferase family [Trichomonas vaginalis G3]EAY08142.1 hypothetical protein TVAG_302290 [Trichomonas vaginalis G3]KAI5548727.1 histone-lysine N-methyltransferase family [Trichomonas vaginalis G3]|eukprot:XP_001320365.1 hypothetical protein [Trichomonas vaginalis G3]
MNSFGKYAGAQHRTPEYFYTAGIHLDISRRNSQNQEKFVNEIEYSYSAPPLENFKDIEYICGSFEKLMNSYTENLPKQIRVILYGAWIDPNFVNARNNKLINLHHFTEIEFALIVEVAKILNDKIPDTVAVLLLMIMGREDKPTVVPKIWPEHVKRMKPLEEEIVSDCGPYNVTSKILLNLLESLNPNRSLVMYRKFEFKKG